MADFGWSDDGAIHELNDKVNLNPDDYEAWTALIKAAEDQEGGLNRNSNPNAIAATREVYDNFLFRFPLLYGFWQRYAQLEFSIAGSEAAESVYERGVAGCPYSVDMWVDYCKFKGVTCHDPEIITELYERGAETIGLDFQAHTFWDLYLEHESRAERDDRRFAILKHIIKIPTFHYQKYYELYRAAAQRQQVENLIGDKSAYEELYNVALRELGSPVEPAFSTLLRKKIDERQLKNYQNIGAEVGERWVYEQNVRIPFFEVKELEESDLENWRQYLAYQEKQGDYTQTKFLFERCLVRTALYPEFWFRYTRWLLAQDDKSEAIRNAYQRASFVFMRVTEPAIRLAWSVYEESEDRVAVSIDIHKAVLLDIPDDVQTHISLAHLYRRAFGLDAAREQLDAVIFGEHLHKDTRGALLSARAQLEITYAGDYTAAGKLFQDNWQSFSDALPFWMAWLDYEADHGRRTQNAQNLLGNVKRIHDLAQMTALLPEDALKQLAAHYATFLYSRGGMDAAKEAVLLDSFVNGTAATRLNDKYRNLFSTYTHVDGARPRLILVDNAE